MVFAHIVNILSVNPGKTPEHNGILFKIYVVLALASLHVELDINVVKHVHRCEDMTDASRIAGH